MDSKQEPEKIIEEKEAQLFRAEQESKAWNNGKYKDSSNAKISKTYVESLRNEVNSLRARLEGI